MKKVLWLIVLLNCMAAPAYADCRSDYDKTVGMLDGLKSGRLRMDKTTFEAAFKTHLQGLAKNNCRAEMLQLQQHIAAEKQRYPKK